MRKNDQKLFTKDLELLHEMLYLRRGGWSLVSLAVLYHCDPSTIYHWCQKLGVEPYKTFDPFSKASKIIATMGFKSKEQAMKESTKIWTTIDGERVCLGRSYREYLAMSIKQK